MDNEEIWKDIDGYDGNYQVSNKGRVRSVKIIKPWEWGCSGYIVSLGKDNKQLVCRLVATAFIENNDKNATTVNHIDGNRLNNNVENLEWLSLADNIRHGFDTGLYDSKCKKVKMTRGTETKIFRSTYEASKYLGRSHSYCHRVARGEHQGYDKNKNKIKIEFLEEEDE